MDDWYLFEKFAMLYYSLRCTVIIKAGKAVLTHKHTALLLAAPWARLQGLTM